MESDRDVLIKALHDIEDGTGRLTPDAVVAAARPEDHPLHEHFEWNDSEAGKRYRIEQARQLIRSVTVEFTIDEKEATTVMYVRDPSVGGEQGYRSVTTLAKDKDDTKAAIAHEFGQAAAHLKRARDIATALGHAEAVGALITRVLDLSRRIEKSKKKPVRERQSVAA
jgi:hypothetical protein